MRDPWTFALAMLTSTLVMPKGTWPASMRRVVVAADWSEPDIELEPLPKEPRRRKDSLALEQIVAEHLADTGATPVRKAAIALGLPRSNVCRGLHRLRDQGRARLGDEGWSLA